MAIKIQLSMCACSSDIKEEKQDKSGSLLAVVTKSFLSVLDVASHVRTSEIPTGLCVPGCSRHPEFKCFSAAVVTPHATGASSHSSAKAEGLFVAAEKMTTVVKHG